RRTVHALNAHRARHGLEPVVPVRVPRVDQIGHHLMTVQSALLILRATDGEIVSFAGDEDLRSASRKGRRIRSGTQDDSLPDGRLVFRSVSAGERIADIEILTSKYSDAVILKKHEDLAEG